MIVLFIQANHNLTGVDYAYLCANMKPVSLANESALEFATARTPVEHAVDFTAITLVSDEVEAVADLAKAYLDSLNKKGYAPSALLPFADKISSELLSDTAAGIGYKGGVDRVASQL